MLNVFFYERQFCVCVLLFVFLEKFYFDHHFDELIFIDIINRIQSISTFYQTSDLEENRNLPGPDITPSIQGESSVRESISNETKDETIELDENIQAENSIEETEIGKQHNLDIDITKLKEVIKEYMKNDDSGFKEEYEVGIAIYFFLFKNIIK